MSVSSLLLEIYYTDVDWSEAPQVYSSDVFADLGSNKENKASMGWYIFHRSGPNQVLYRMYPK